MSKAVLVPGGVAIIAVAAGGALWASLRAYRDSCRRIVTFDSGEGSPLFPPRPSVKTLLRI